MWRQASVPDDTHRPTLCASPALDQATCGLAQCHMPVIWLVGLDRVSTTVWQNTSPGLDARVAGQGSIACVIQGGRLAPSSPFGFYNLWLLTANNHISALCLPYSLFWYMLCPERYRFFETATSRSGIFPRSFRN